MENGTVEITIIIIKKKKKLFTNSTKRQIQKRLQEHHRNLFWDL